MDIVTRKSLQIVLFSWFLLFSFSLTLIAQDKPPEEKSSEDQDKARQSHAEWQARDPEKHTFDVGDYVSYAQERQQERNEEVASFVNRDRQDT